MDPNLQSVILGLITNGLTSLIAKLGHKSGELLIGKDFLEKWELEKTALLPMLQRAIRDVEETIEWEGPPSLNVTCLFLLTPEVESIVRQVYSVRLLENKKLNDLEVIQKEFLASFSLYTDLDKSQLASSAKTLFSVLVDACGHALSRAIDQGILSAHEAQSAFRHRILLDELSAIKKNLAFLSSKQKPDVKEILSFEEKYRQQVASRHGFIIPPYFDAARKVPIDDLFVSPQIITIPKKGTEPEKLNLPVFLFGMHRAVLLGNPGGGKSTFASKLSHDFATKDSERLLGGREQITPILVVLRDYGAEKKSRNCSILQFIEAKANALYQLQPPPNAFEYLLLNGRAVIIFDGLDELLDTHYRQEISSDVEAFCTLYPSIPVLVTSREVGYEQAPLDEKRFKLYRLGSFDDTQVKEYVTKWFHVDTDLAAHEQEQKIRDFLKESKVVSDLRSNPLMLALMCNIYRGDNDIPKNRPDVYEKCATMLFERWDKSRGIHIPLPFEAHISPAMKYLAYWIYSDEGLRGGVTERRLIEKATEYLSPRRFEDHDEAERAACEFIEFCRGRAWVFTDTGTTREGIRLYQFTHQTFLEYFTAAYLVRTNPTPAALFSVLLPRIIKREWDVVAQLAFQLLNKQVEGAGDDLLTMLIERVYEIEGSEQWNVLSFTVRCLEFIIPRPDITREITKVSLDYYIGRDSKPIAHIRNDVESNILSDLLFAASENRIVIAGSLEKQLVETIKNENDTKSSLALGIGLYLHLFYIGTVGRSSPPNDAEEFWKDISDRVFNSSVDRIMTLCPKFMGICHNALWRGKVNIADFIKWFGINSVFEQIHMNIFIDRSVVWDSLAEEFFTDTLSFDLSSNRGNQVLQRKFVNSFDVLRDIANILLYSPLPWIRQMRTSRGVIFRRFRINLPKQLPSNNTLTSVDADILFALITIVAAMISKDALSNDDSHENYFEQWTTLLKTSEHPIIVLLRHIVLAHFEQVSEETVQAALDNCRFTNEQRNFIWRWVRREVDLVEIIEVTHEDGNMSSSV